MHIQFPKHPDLAQEVAAWMAAHDIRPTAFGKLSVGDPSLIATLEEGRELRSDTLRRIRHFMASGHASPTRQPLKRKGARA